MPNIRLPALIILLATRLLAPSDIQATVLFSKKTGRTTLQNLLQNDWSLCNSFIERGMTVEIYRSEHKCQKGPFVLFARCERSGPKVAEDTIMCDLLEPRRPITII